MHRPFWGSWLPGLRASLGSAAVQPCNRKTLCEKNLWEVRACPPLPGTAFKPRLWVSAVATLPMPRHVPPWPQPCPADLPSSQTCLISVDLSGCHWAVAGLVYCLQTWSCHWLADLASWLDLGPAPWLWTCLRTGSLSWTSLLSLDLSCLPC